MAYSDCANNAEIGQFDLILDQTIHGNVVAPQATSVEKKVPKCIAVASTYNEAATNAIWTWSHLGCKSHVEHVLDIENSKFSWLGTVFTFTLEVRVDSWGWSLLTIPPHPVMGGSQENEQAAPTSSSSTSSTIATSTTSCSSAVTTLSFTFWS